MSTATAFIGEQERVTSAGKRITARPATRTLYTPINTPATQKLRVAAYARVSTDNEEQLTSYEAQVDYYTRYIKSRPDMEFMGLYADEGISAVSTAKRDGFKRMIKDALDGKFDRILTKSVSRFARNTVDSLTMIRKLKEKGVGVTFEKENIDTLDSKGELLITIMSSLAQEESRSISENTTWGQRKRFSDGKVTMPFSHFLGYDRGEKGEPVINEEEAKIVRLIYKLFLDGKSVAAIARYLMANNIPTPAGKKKWQTTTITSILTNEKYKGDALLQKTFTVDFLTKKTKRNDGEVQSYYVRGSHPAIVSEEVFDLAQSELRRRQESGRHICSDSIFAGKLVCGECGGLYGSKVWNSNSKYRRVIWRCNNKYKKKSDKDKGFDILRQMTVPSTDTTQPETVPFIDTTLKGAALSTDTTQPEMVPSPDTPPQITALCTTPHLSDEQIKSAFITMLNNMIDSSDEIAAFYDAYIAKLTDTAALEAQKAPLETKAVSLATQIHDWIRDNASRAMAKEVYDARYDKLNGELTTIKDSLSRINDELLRLNAKHTNALQVLNLVSLGKLVTEFDAGLFGALVDCVTVYIGKMVFRLKDGSERIV